MSNRARSTRSSARLKPTQDDPSDDDVPRTRSSTRAQKKTPPVKPTVGRATRKSSTTMPAADISPIQPRSGSMRGNSTRLLAEIDSEGSDYDHASHSYRHDHDSDVTDDDQDETATLNSSTDSVWRDDHNLHLKFNPPHSPQLRQQQSFRGIDASNNDTDYDEDNSILYPPSAARLHHQSAPGTARRQSMSHTPGRGRTPSGPAKPGTSIEVRSPLSSCTVSWVIIVLAINLLLVLWAVLNRDQLATQNNPLHSVLDHLAYDGSDIANTPHPIDGIDTVGDLCADMIPLVSYKEMEAQLQAQALKGEQYQRELLQTNKQMTALQSDLTSYQQQLQDMKGLLAEKDAALQSASAAIAASTSAPADPDDHIPPEVVEALQKRVTQLEHAQNTCIEDLTKLQNLANESSESLTTCLAEKDELLAMQRECEQKLQKASEELLVATSAPEPQLITRETCSMYVDEVESKLTTLRSDYDSCITSLDSKDNDLASCQSVTSRLQAELELTQQQCEQHCDQEVDSKHDEQASTGHQDDLSKDRRDEVSDSDDNQQDGDNMDGCDVKLNNCISMGNAYKLLHNSTRQECREFVKSISKAHADTCTTQCLEIYNTNVHLYNHHQADHDHHHHGDSEESCPHHHHHHHHGDAQQAKPSSTYEITEHDDEGIIELKTTRDTCIKQCETTAVQNLIHFTRDFGEDFDADDKSDLRAHMEVNAANHLDSCSTATEELQQEVTSCVTKLISLQTQYAELQQQLIEINSLQKDVATSPSTQDSTPTSNPVATTHTIGDLDRESLVSALTKLESELTYVRSELSSITDDFAEHQREQLIILSHPVFTSRQDASTDPLQKLFLPVDPTAPLRTRTLATVSNILYVMCICVLSVFTSHSLLPKSGIAKFLIALMWLGLSLHLFVSNMLVFSTLVFGIALTTLVVIPWPNKFALSPRNTS